MSARNSPRFDENSTSGGGHAREEAHSSSLCRQKPAVAARLHRCPPHRVFSRPEMTHDPPRLLSRRVARVNRHIPYETTMSINGNELLKAISKHVVELTNEYINQLAPDDESSGLEHGVSFLLTPKGRKAALMDLFSTCLDNYMSELSSRQEGSRIWKTWTAKQQAFVRAFACLKESDTVNLIWQHSGGDCEIASALLFVVNPHKYLFMRDLGKRHKIVAGIRLISDAIDQLGPDAGGPFSDDDVEAAFTKRESYESLMCALTLLAERLWPVTDRDVNADAERPWRLIKLFYEVLPKLVDRTRPRTGYWIGVSKEDHNTEEIMHEETVSTGWSANDDVRPGDIYFMYCTRPIGKITRIYQVESVTCDPLAPWKGHWAVINLIPGGKCALDFKDMKAHPKLGQISMIRGQFQGVTVRELRPYEYMDLRTVLIEQGLDPTVLAPASAESLVDRPSIANERDLDLNHVKPLFESMGFALAYNDAIPIYTGRGTTHVRPDFVVRDSRNRVVAIIENKVNTVHIRDQDAAWNQARSYGLQLGAASIIIASPDAIRVYCRDSTRLDFNGTTRAPDWEGTFTELDTTRSLQKLTKLLMDAL